ncbi:MAG: hypothetical protein Kow0042_27440 [Calditrichia bacterium]
MTDIIEQFKQFRIIPVVTIPEPEIAQPLADALLAGGLPCVEITFRTAAAEEALRILGQRMELLLGAGTILNLDQVKSAVDAGARFIVTPGFHPGVVEYCLSNNIPVFPGTSTATDLIMAVEYDLKVVKFFPAEALGGVKTLKALSAPFPMLGFIPTGGIQAENLSDYLALPQVVACGGSWLVKTDLLRNRQFDQITELTREAVHLVSQMKKSG